jgi:ATP-dependent exoDNAse (exonuclease V) beta subunit
VPAPGGAGARTLSRLPPAWRAPPVPAGIAPATAVRTDPETAPEFDWAGRIARAIGVVVHRIIELAGSRGGAGPAIAGGWDNADLVRVLLAEQGLNAEEAEAAAREVMAALAGFSRDPRAAWIFDPSHPRRVHEYAVTVTADRGFRRLVPDCVLEDQDGILWIIDFKTGRHLGGDPEGFLDRERERYRPQLETYARALEAEHAGPIRLGLYYPLLAGWREWSWRD